MPGGTLAVPTGTLINQGTIRTTNTTSLTGNITTAGGGLLDVTAPTSHSGGALDATGGNILVGAKLNVGTLMNHGGQITGSGPSSATSTTTPASSTPRRDRQNDDHRRLHAGAGATLAIEAQGVDRPPARQPPGRRQRRSGRSAADRPRARLLLSAQGDILDVIDYSGDRDSAFSSSAADPAFTGANPVNVGYNARPQVRPRPDRAATDRGPPHRSPSLLGSPLYQRYPRIAGAERLRSG